MVEAEEEKGLLRLESPPNISLYVNVKEMHNT